MVSDNNVVIITGTLCPQCSEEMSGHFGQLMLALLNGDRDESPEGDMDSADAQADTLHECGGESC